MKPFPVPKQGLGSSGFHKTLLSVALLLFAMCPASAQWQRIEMDAKGGVGNSVRSASLTVLSNAVVGSRPEQ
jgi:hypothetical protein